jgi:hypothetical protein
MVYTWQMQHSCEVVQLDLCDPWWIEINHPNMTHYATFDDMEILNFQKKKFSKIQLLKHRYKHVIELGLTT